MKTLKLLIQNETGVAPCAQNLNGLKGNGFVPVSDRRKLSELNLPRENFVLLLNDVETDQDDGTKEVNESENRCVTHAFCWAIGVL